MKVKVIETGEIREVFQDFTQAMWFDKTQPHKSYRPNELEFLPDTSEKVIEGWIAVDEWGIGGCFLHTQNPHTESKEFCDTGEYEIGWESDGEKYELDSKLFPDMDCESEPKRVKLTITPMEE